MEHALEHVEHVGTWSGCQTRLSAPIVPAPKGRLGKPCSHSLYCWTYTLHGITVYNRISMDCTINPLWYSLICVHTMSLYFLVSSIQIPNQLCGHYQILWANHFWVNMDESIYFAAQCKSQLMLKFTSTNRIKVEYYDEYYTHHTKCFWHVSFPLDGDPPPVLSPSML